MVEPVDNREISDGRGPVTEEIQSTYMDAARGEVEEYKDWLHLVD